MPESIKLILHVMSGQMLQRYIYFRLAILVYKFCN